MQPLAGYLQNLDLGMFLGRGIGHYLYDSYLSICFHLLIQLIVCFPVCQFYFVLLLLPAIANAMRTPRRGYN